MRTILFLALASLLTVQAADPTGVLFWKADKYKELDQKLAPKTDPERHLASERLMEGSFLLYRDGNSEGEIHTEKGDFIVARTGEGTMLVGGKLDGKTTAPGEQRGVIIGGTKYAMTPGDTLYVPPNTPHQFLVDSGKHFTALIIKITPDKK